MRLDALLGKMAFTNVLEEIVEIRILSISSANPKKHTCYSTGVSPISFELAPHNTVCGATPVH